MVLLLLGCIPGISWFIWSGHGGVGWLLLPLCFPYIVIRLAILVFRSQPDERNHQLRVAVACISLYVLTAYPATYYAEHYINSTIGPFIQRGTLFRLTVFPAGLAIPNHNPRP